MPGASVFMRRTNGVRRRNNRYSHNVPDRLLPGGFERAFNVLRIWSILAWRLWVMGGISIVFEHLRDDGTSD